MRKTLTTIAAVAAVFLAPVAARADVNEDKLHRCLDSRSADTCWQAALYYKGHMLDGDRAQNCHASMDGLLSESAYGMISQDLGALEDAYGAAKTAQSICPEPYAGAARQLRNVLDKQMASGQ